MTNEIVDVWGFEIDAWKISEIDPEFDESDPGTSMENYLCSHPRLKHTWERKSSSTWYVLAVNNRYESVELEDFDYFLAKKHVRNETSPEKMREFWKEESESVIAEGHRIRESLDIPMAEKVCFSTCDSDFDRTPDIFNVIEG